MWYVTVRSPDGEPKQYSLQPGSNIAGRLSYNAIYIEDISASRRHADLIYDPVTDSLTISDMGSKNGTYVNRKKITESQRLQPSDIIRIGNCMLDLSYYKSNHATGVVAGPRRHTRELLLESLDRHAVLIYEVARQLNTVLDLPTALSEVSSLMRKAMGAERCEVILADQFDRLHELGFPETIARKAIKEHATIIIPDFSTSPTHKDSDSARLYGVRSVLCVPVISGDNILALIYMYKTEPDQLPFTERDLQLAVAISHQAALTIQRMYLLESLKKQQHMQTMLRRFLSPRESEFILNDYLQSGYLPKLAAKEVTVLFADIANSTGFAEQHGPERFGTLLEHFYQDTAEIIFTHGGMLKLMGDGIMSVFGTTKSFSDPATSAAQAGLDLVERIKTGEFYIEEGIVIGVGINTGPAMAGYVGTQERVEYTVLGDTVNVAFRMQDYARPNRVVVSQNVAISLAGHFETTRIGDVNVRGRSEPVKIFEVLGPC
ncbi:MAG: FHA domain-containing protein [Anaerolineales bacterium]|nr:FHA domain-containing protein [Anaerolineales bacterium]